MRMSHTSFLVLCCDQPYVSLSLNDGAQPKGTHCPHQHRNGFVDIAIQRTAFSPSRHNSHPHQEHQGRDPGCLGAGLRCGRGRRRLLPYTQPHRQYQ